MLQYEIYCFGKLVSVLLFLKLIYYCQSIDLRISNHILDQNLNKMNQLFLINNQNYKKDINNLTLKLTGLVRTQKLLFYESKCVHSCLQLLYCGFNKSGRYIIALSRNYKKEVCCDQTTDGGGWTMFLRNKYGNITFSKNWVEYRNGFGNLHYDFWLGNDFLYKAATFYNSRGRRATQLYVKLMDKYNATFYSKYNNFNVLSEAFKYELRISRYITGTAGDSLTPHNDMRFTTKDHDNDLRNDMNCATAWNERGGWWHNGCYDAALSVTWHGDNSTKRKRYTPGPIWYYVHLNRLPLKSATMMFREKQFP